MFGRWVASIALALGLASHTSPSRAERTPLLPEPERLQLSWPVAPASFSFEAREEGQYAGGPLQLYRAESLWFAHGLFSLLSIGSAERAFELDCRLTCQPVLQGGLALEGRLQLYDGVALRDVAAFIRYEATASPALGRPRLDFARGMARAGVRGWLDF